MKKTSNMIVIISTFLIVIGVVLGSILTDYGSLISSIVTTITAVIGAIALFIQFKKDKAVNQASFIVDFYEKFNSSDQNERVLDELNKKFEDKNYKTQILSMHSEVLSYLYWVRTLCSFINNKVIDFEIADEMFSYRFFSITNNKAVQEMELEKFDYLYKLIYKTHRNWSAWRAKKGLPAFYPDEDLALTKNYAAMSK